MNSQTLSNLILFHLSFENLKNKYIRISASLSSLISLNDPFTSRAISQRIQIVFPSLSSLSTQVTFTWIPGHTNSEEHDAVDLAAKETTNITKITFSTRLPLSDLKTFYSNPWNSKWSHQHTNKLHLIEKNIKS